YQCTLNNDGTFSSCAYTPALAPPAPNWSITSNTASAYATAYSQYAYVAANGNHVYQCTIDPTTGLYKYCAQTPSSMPGTSAQGIFFTTVFN
ncbi:hypothetical protein ABTN16_19125, partial [Acinetobacter baumannii]